VTERQDPGNDFKERLLARLRAVVAERAAAAAPTAPPTTTPIWRRRGPRLAFGGGFALAAVAVALVVSAGDDSSSKAFAVEPREGGGVTIEIYSLEDASGLEGALEEAGIESQVTWLPPGKICREPHYKPSVVHLPGGGTFGGMTMGGPGGAITIGVGGTQQSRERFGEYRRGEISAEEYRKSTPNLNLDPEAFHADQSVVISGAPAPYAGDPEGGSVAQLGVAKGPVEPCEPVPAPPDGNGPLGLPSAGGGPAYVPRGDDAQPRGAAAVDLRRAGAAAASAAAVAAPPHTGQFLYAKTELTELEGWLPKGQGKGSKAHPRYFVPINDPSARYALVPTRKEVWTAADGTTRVREALGRVDFLAGSDQRLWEAAGSPPPFAYDPAEHAVGRDGSGRPVKDFAARAFRGRHEFTFLSRLAQLPTEPEALRLSVENRHGGSSPIDPSPAGSPRGGGTVETLLEILAEPLAGPALRAAAFGALAEIPGIGFERDVADLAGRTGDAISWSRGGGFGRRFIFDPRTSQILSEAEVIFDARAAGYSGVPDDTVFRETAYLRSGIVGSTRERPAAAQDAGR